MKTSILKFEEVGQALQQDYFEKARYLRDRGYAPHDVDLEKLASQIFYAQQKEKLKGESSDQDSIDR
jgi:hypothetical protein